MKVNVGEGELLCETKIAKCNNFKLSIIVIQVN